ncbi:MAG: amidase family protein, partial [Burkholderiaceae bacterium]
NNIFALRPSMGRVPVGPALDVWIAQMSTEGPMGRTSRDVALLLETQAGYDPRVPLSLPGGERYADALDDLDCRRVRVGWLADLGGYLPMEPGVLETCEQGLQRLRGLGCAVEPTQPGFSPAEIWQAWLVWRRMLVATRIAPYLVKPENRAQIKPEALWEHDQAASLTGTQFMNASIQRSAYCQQMLALFEHCDVLALPSAQVWPFDAEQRWPKQINGREMDTYHRWMEVTIYATFAGLPCMCVPVGFGSTGLPMGMQLIGRPRSERMLLQLAHGYEQAAQDVLQIKPKAR